MDKVQLLGLLVRAKDSKEENRWSGSYKMKTPPPFSSRSYLSEKKFNESLMECRFGDKKKTVLKNKKTDIQVDNEALVISNENGEEFSRKFRIKMTKSLSETAFGTKPGPTIGERHVSFRRLPQSSDNLFDFDTDSFKSRHHVRTVKE